VEVKERYQVKISNRSTALENLNDNVDINRAWKSIRENIKASTTESVRHYKLKQYNHGLMMNVQNY
jgi:hypothetical protein